MLLKFRKCGEDIKSEEILKKLNLKKQKTLRLEMIFLYIKIANILKAI